ncbi:MAG: LuxR C-terminal-related transcriptional regulator [Burkholderiales bacterium]
MRGSQNLFRWLATRECEVINGVARKSNKVIDAEPGVSWKTVEMHCANAMHKACQCSS